jgi:DNA-directed RNA polymerase subunit RPC12/RpoP
MPLTLPNQNCFITGLLQIAPGRINNLLKQMQEGDNFMIQFHCEYCGQKFSVPQTSAGKKGRCPKCKKVIVVPQSTMPVNPTPSPQEDEPLRLKYDYDLPAESDRPVYTMPQQGYRRGQETAADVIADKHKSEAADEPPSATILNVFTFPFSLSGILHFIFFLFVPVLFTLFLPVTDFGLLFRCAYIFLSFVFYGYLFYYMSSCIIASAKGDIFAPDASLGDVTTISDLLRHLRLLFASVFICFSPFAGYALYRWLFLPGKQMPFIGFFAVLVYSSFRCSCWPYQCSIRKPPLILF